MFSHPQYLEGISDKTDYWVALINGEPTHYWPVCSDSRGRMVQPAMAQYLGPSRSDWLLEKSFHRQWSIQARVLHAFLETFSANYGNLAFTLRPGQDDIRHFHWWSDKNSESVRLRIEPCYTAMIRNLDQISRESLLASFRRDRRKQLARAQSMNLQLIDDVVADEILDLYHALLAGKGCVELARSRADQIHNVVVFAQSGRGRVIAFRDELGRLGAALVMLYSSTIAHSVIAVARPEIRNRGFMALLRLTAIRWAEKDGLSAFDFTGANSQKGADEKHSYGATPKLYFRITNL